jgi:6-pyruvoyltetrahydropterin/6-carboxytetrahydropterin synthase
MVSLSDPFVHKLKRQVRFSINPFLQAEVEGANSYASKPTGEGLSIFFELSVGLTASLDHDTGFVMNVLDIDETVRESVVPLFAERIKTDFRNGRHIGLYDIAEILKSARQRLIAKVGSAVLSELSLKLNPFRELSLDCSRSAEDSQMIYFSEKFEFAAMHRLWNDEFSDERNFALFGKCANPTGHGHNYVIEVTVKTPPQGNDFCIGDFEKVVDDEFIKHVDHKNLNIDVSGLTGLNPTVENIVSFAWHSLVDKFGLAELHCVTVWETDKTSCSYCGQQE